MIKEAIDYLFNKGEESAARLEKLYGEDYIISKGTAVRIIPPSLMPGDLEVCSLTGLIDYLNNKVEEDLYTDEDLIIHVINPKTVKFYKGTDGYGRRSCLVSCYAHTPSMSFDNYHNAEDFNIMLQANFIKDFNVESVLAVVGNIKEEQVKNTGDDGITQQVVAKKGIAMLQNVAIPNPVILRPFRTFIEVEQPESQFVLRLKDGPKCALFEADGGIWKLKAMKNIKDYLQENIENKDVKILA